LPWLKQSAWACSTLVYPCASLAYFLFSTNGSIRNKGGEVKRNNAAKYAPIALVFLCYNSPMPEKKMPPEYRLILLCARLAPDSSQQQEIFRLLHGPLDWPKILGLANRQEILPFLYLNFKKNGLAGIIPRDTFAKMEHCYYANLQYNLKVEREMLLLLELTELRGTGIIPFKGFSLIQTLYRDPGLRIMADVDILAKQEQLPKIKDILNQLGYREVIKGPPRKQHQEYKYDIPFLKTTSSGQPLLIEVHCALFPPRPYRVNLPCLWQRAREETLNGQKQLFLSGEDTFLSLAMHLRRHTRRLTLKFIVDIAELLNSRGDTLDWRYIKKSAGDNRAISSIYASLYLAQELLQTATSPKIINEFSPHFTKKAFIHFIINKYNFFTLKKWQGLALRFLLFDRAAGFLLYLWRVSFWERFIRRV
jgi:hypothetical protein